MVSVSGESICYPVSGRLNYSSVYSILNLPPLSIQLPLGYGVPDNYTKEGRQ